MIRMDFHDIDTDRRTYGCSQLVGIAINVPFFESILGKPYSKLDFLSLHVKLNANKLSQLRARIIGSFDSNVTVPSSKSLIL